MTNIPSVALPSWRILEFPDDSPQAYSPRGGANDARTSLLVLNSFDLVSVVSRPFFRLRLHRAKLIACLAFCASTALAAPEIPVRIRLDASSSGRVFEGIGAVSAGASTRLLPDYPEPQRSEILDFLFKPKFGAGFQHLKVEIGGGENSTCGSEPSHAITWIELADPKPRGYEFWLMAEARKRNPKVILDCLPWTFPRWVGDRFSSASAEWLASFLEVAKRQYGLEIDWVSAAQNEMGTDLNWIRKDLRPTLDARGFSKVRLQAPDDDSEYWKVFDLLEKDPEVDRLIDAVGYHYLDGREPWQIDQKKGRDATESAKQSGKPLWASEEWSQSGREWGGKGALYLARLMNKLYIRDRITKFQIWCPVDSIYDPIRWSDTGVMQADMPWCGHYSVWPALWIVAHTTQFADPGWIYIDNACGQFSPDTWRATHIALRDPRSGDWTVVVVTGDRQRIQLNIGAGLKTGPVFLWKSTAKEQFIRIAPVALRNNSLELELEPEAVYTFTTTTGQVKGSHGPPPARRPFPLPYTEDFERYDSGQTPRLLADQKGTFEVSLKVDGGKCLTQIVPEQGILWYDNWLVKPHTLFGELTWRDYLIEAEVLLAGGDIEVGGRYLDGDRKADLDKLAYRWILTRDGRWQLNWQYTTLATGQLVKFDASIWHRVRLEMRGDKISGFIDGRKLASITDGSRAQGLAYLASTYDRNGFDNVRVAPLDEEASK